MRRAIRLGIIGCGEHAFRAHAQPVFGADEFQLTAVFDPNAQASAQFCQTFGPALQVCISEDALLASNVEAVLIANPNPCHAASIQKAFKAGKHVLAEKPLATDAVQLEALRTLLRYGKPPELVFSSCHPQRFDTPYLWLKQALPGLRQCLGPVIHFGFDFSAQSYHAQRLGIPSMMLDHVNHDIDLLHFLFGHQVFQAHRILDAPDRYFVCGQRVDELSFSFEGSYRAHQGLSEQILRLRFARGLLTLNARKGYAFIQDFHLDTEQRVDCGVKNYALRNQAIMRNFAACIRQNAAPYLGLDDLWVNAWLGVQLREKGWTTYPGGFAYFDVDD